MRGRSSCCQIGPYPNQGGRKERERSRLNQCATSPGCACRSATGDEAWIAFASSGSAPSRNASKTLSVLRHSHGGLHLPARLHVARAHGEDPLDVHVEGDLEARLAGRCRAQAAEEEVAEQLVVRDLRLVSLEDAHGHFGLVVV